MMRWCGLDSSGSG